MLIMIYIIIHIMKWNLTTVKVTTAAETKVNTAAETRN